MRKEVKQMYKIQHRKFDRFQLRSKIVYGHFFASLRGTPKKIQKAMFLMRTGYELPNDVEKLERYTLLLQSSVTKRLRNKNLAKKVLDRALAKKQMILDKEYDMLMTRWQS